MNIWGISAERQLYQNNQIKILNWKNIISEMKNSKDVFNSLQDNAEEKFSEHEGETVEMIQTERREKDLNKKQTKINKQKTKASVPRGKVSISLTYIVSFPEVEENSTYGFTLLRRSINRINTHINHTQAHCKHTDGNQR